MAAPAFGSAGTRLISTTANWAVPVPAGVKAGDIIVVTLMVSGSNTITVRPSGFAAAEGSPAAVTGGTATSMHIEWKRATGADTGTYDFTASASGFGQARAFRYTGCLTAGSPWDTPTEKGNSGGNTGTCPAVDVDTGGPNRMLFYAGWGWATDTGTWTVPSGFTERDGGASTSNIEVSDKILAAAAGSGVVQASSTITANSKGSWLGALVGDPAPAFGSIGTAYKATGASPAFPVPAGVAAGDIIVVAFQTDTPGSTVSAVPTGFALAENGFAEKTGSPDAQQGFVYWKRATAADSGTYGFTMSASIFVNGFATRYTGAAAAGTPWDPGAAIAVSGSASQNAPDVNITTKGPDRLLIQNTAAWHGDEALWSPPSGMIERGGGSAANCEEVADKSQAVAGATGNLHASNTATAGFMISWLGALIAGVAGAAPAVSIPPMRANPAVAGPGMAPFAGPQPFGVAVVGGAQQFDVPATDDVGLTDSAVFDQTKVFTDSAGLTDTVALTQAKVITDSVGLTDSAALDQTKVFTDDAGLTDTTTVGLVLGVTVTDSVGLTDGVALTVAPVFTDSAGLTDSALLTRALVATDSAGLTDSAVVASTFAAAATDSVGLTDSAIVGLQRDLAATDSAGLTDTALITQAKVATDSAGLTDTAALDRSGVFTDDAGLTDSALVQLSKLVTATDSAGLTDSAALDRFLVPTDSAGLTDNTAVTQAKVVTDDAGLTDTALVSAGRLLDVTDSAGLTDSAVLDRSLVATDSAGLTDSTALTQARVVTDSAGLTDTTTTGVQRDLAVTDSAGLTDSALITRALVPTDSAGLTDSAALAQLRVVTDSAGLTDSAVVTSAHLFAVAATDSVGLTDYIVFGLPPPWPGPVSSPGLSGRWQGLLGAGIDAGDLPTAEWDGELGKARSIGDLDPPRWTGGPP